MSPTFSEFVFFSLLSVANGLGRREPEEEEVLRGHHPETDGDDGAAECEQVQSFPSHHAERFFGKVLGSSPGLWAPTAASYCPSMAGEMQKQNMTKPHERWDGKLCRINAKNDQRSISKDPNLAKL